MIRFNVSGWWLVVFGVLALPFLVAGALIYLAFAVLAALAVGVGVVVGHLDRRGRRRYRNPQRLTRHGWSVPW